MHHSYNDGTRFFNFYYDISISGDSKQKLDHGNVVNRALHAVKPTLSKLVGLL